MKIKEIIKKEKIDKDIEFYKSVEEKINKDLHDKNIPINVTLDIKDLIGAGN